MLFAVPPSGGPNAAGSRGMTSAPMDAGLKDKVVLVTGASGGIGQAVARAFAAEGARLVLHANKNLAAADQLQSQLKTESLAIQANLAHEAEVESLFKKSLSHFGGIDVLVANAGIWNPDAVPIHEMSLDRWNETVRVDQTAVFLCAREFFRHLNQRKPENASMVIVGSTAAVFGEEGHAEYAAAKAAITYGLTRTLKNEIVRIVPRGRVNAVAPGWTLTPMAEPSLAEGGEFKRVLQTRALKRIARVEDVARAIVFLASHSLAGHITGEILTLSGGMEGRLLHDPEHIDPTRA